MNARYLIGIGDETGDQITDAERPEDSSLYDEVSPPRALICQEARFEKAAATGRSIVSGPAPGG